MKTWQAVIVAASAAAALVVGLGVQARPPGPMTVEGVLQPPPAGEPR